MLKYRLTFGPLLIAALLAGMWLDQWLDGITCPAFMRGGGRETWPPGVVIFIVCAIVSVLAARELTRILREKGIEASARVNSVLAVLGLTVSCVVPEVWSGATGASVTSTITVIAFVGSMAFFARKRRVEGMIAAAGGALVAYAYLGLLFGFIPAIRREHPAWALVWVLLTTKSCDIGAYFTGVSIGRHKLIPWISPGKTWEGLVGGVITSAAVGSLGAWGISTWTGTALPGVVSAAAAGLVFGLVGQVGDLAASLLKRDAGVKDSGSSLPGFGGVIDVIDSPLLVAPVAFWWLRTVEVVAVG